MAFIVAGCSTSGSSHVAWNGTTRGTVFFVDETTQKTVFTQSVDGVHVEFNLPSPQDAEHFREVSNSTNCVFYFVPKH